MTTETNLLEDVLLAFRCENEHPTADAVLAWTNRYPRFANEIREAAALWAEMEVQEALHRPSPDDERLVAEARSAAVDALRRALTERSRTVDARSLADAVRQAGTTAAELGRQMSLPTSVVSQVVRGKIMGATIPEVFTRMLARLLGRDADWVREHYPGGVVTAHVSPNGGERAPTGVTTSDSTDLTFQEAVVDANGMDEAQLRFWLEEA